MPSEGSNTPAHPSPPAEMRSSAAIRAQPPLGVRAIRRTARAIDQIRAALGLHRARTVAGVKYTETSAETLRRALSRRGTGVKEFIAEFPGGSRQTIHCTPSRIYADLMEPRLLPCYGMTLPCLRPGMRALDFGCGTGYGAAWLLDAVGPSGAVVAVDRDEESIQYAQRRYAAPNVAFEVGWLGSLAGEIDGAFELVVSLDALRDDDDARAVIRELWRVLRPGGWLLIVAPAPLGPGHTRAGELARAFEPRELTQLVKDACEAQINARADEGESPTQVRWEERAIDAIAAAQAPQSPASPNAPQAGQAESVSNASTPDHTGVLLGKPAR